MNDEHIFALVETINGAYLHAIHQLAPDAAFIDDVCQMSSSFWGSLSGFQQGGMFSSVSNTATDAVRDFGVSNYFGSGAFKEIPDEGEAAS